MHDEQQSHETQHRGGNMVIRLTPVQVFLSGLAGGVLVLCTVGFFILLGMNMSDGPKPKVVANNPTVQPAAAGPEQAGVQIREVDEKTDHIRGNKNADVTLVTYTDLECPFCKRFHDTTAQLLQKYGNELRIVYRHFPLDQLHAQARTEALATECAGEQGKFWELIDIIFAQTTSNDGLDLAKLPEYAKQAGVKDVNKFNKCLADKKYTDKVAADEQDAQTAGAQGTPYSVLVGPNGELVPVNGAQPLAALEATVQQFLK